MTTARIDIDRSDLVVALAQAAVIVADHDRQQEEIETLRNAVYKLQHGEGSWGDDRGTIDNPKTTMGMYGLVDEFRRRNTQFRHLKDENAKLKDEIVLLKLKLAERPQAEADPVGGQDRT